METRALRVMTLNLRRDIEADGEHRWLQRRDAVASLVARLEPHVLGTQEGLPHQLADLDKSLAHYRRVGTCRDGNGLGEHVALYYDPRRLIVVAHGDVWLSDTPDAPASRSWGNRLPRHATWARFTDQETGASFTAVNTHLDHESAGSRERAAAFLAERFPDALILGDLNEAPGGHVWTRLAGAGRRDALAGADERATYHAFTGTGRTRIDGILVPDTFRVARAMVVDGRIDGRFVSDHHPVYAEVMVMSVDRAAEAVP